MRREKKKIRTIPWIFMAAIAFMCLPAFSVLVSAQSEEIIASGETTESTQNQSDETGQETDTVETVEIVNEENTIDKGWTLDAATGELKIYSVNVSGTMEDTSYLEEARKSHRLSLKKVSPKFRTELLRNVSEQKAW